MLRQFIRDDKHIIFCGGAFYFDYRKDGYQDDASKDYRAKLLGSTEMLLRGNGAKEVIINDNVTYIGPFYFETENMKSESIILCEKEMIECCSDAIFLLDNASCPGTIAEIIYANSLNKTLHLFYIQCKDDEETESELHTPCWYPIQFCQITNKSTKLYSCANIEDAINKILLLVESLGQ